MGVLALWGRGTCDGGFVQPLNDKRRGAIVIVMQRLHEDDLAGHVLRQEEWDIERFPAKYCHDRRVTEWRKMSVWYCAPIMT